MTAANDLLISFLDAGKGDCALLQFHQGRFNVLVDAGPRAPHAQLERMIENLRTLLPGGVIDLAIITHHDNDHIGGFPKLFEETSGLEIRELIFNSPGLVAEFLSETGTTKISAHQGYLVAKAKRPRHHRVVIAEDHLTFFDGLVELVFLSPTPAAIDDHGHVTQWPASETTKISPKKPFRPYAQLKEEADHFKEDSSESNCLSLAFEVRFDERAWLFLGDAWASTVKTGLDAIHHGDKPHYALVKLSHHGSQGNTDAALLSRFSCNDFVIPTNGHKHPDEQVFRRLLDAADSPPRIHFPRKTPELEDLLQHYRDCVHFPAEGEILQFKYRGTDGGESDHGADRSDRS